MIRKTILLLLLLVALIFAAAWWVHGELNTPYFGGETAGTFVEIQRGATCQTIAGSLCDAGIIKSRIPFLAYIRWRDAGRRLQAGDYRFASPATPIQVAQRLMQGDVFYYSVTIPEGLTAAETVEQIVRAGIGDRGELLHALQRTDWIRDLDPEARTLEGYLFPDTYRFGRKTSSDQIIRTMVLEFRDKCGALLAQHPLRPGWNLARMVTLASLVEKETGNRDERYAVASVFTNRLARSMPLACDPTVIYALKLAGKYDGNIRKPDLQLPSPYNTYVRKGLPPGPIASPGIESLRAALAPAKTDFLFFVSRNDGTHQFSKDFRAHQKAVDQYQKRSLH